MAHRNVNAAEKLRAAHIKLAAARVALMDIAQYSTQPHIQKLARDTLSVLNDPVDKYVGTRSS